MESRAKKKPKAVVVGGSIAGVCSAHALLSAGWDVVVLEKSLASAPAAGAGLGLDPLSCALLETWLGPNRLYAATLPLNIDQNQTMHKEEKTLRVLTRDESYNFRAAHWAHLHSLLCAALPPGVLLWGRLFVSFDTCVHDEKAAVSVKAKVLSTGEVVEIIADLLVAADGCLSSVCRTLLPHHKLRYAGYCAWRGVFDFSAKEDSVTILTLRKAYPDLGKCLYFDHGSRTHTVLYELLNKRMNWIWYVNQPEPHLKGNSLTMKVSQEMTTRMHEEAEKTWNPALARLIKETKDPFLNVIYDANPLERVVWGSVVMVGDAAHPTTPHCLRGTNMAILDAAVLGKCLEKWGHERLGFALSEYESTRVSIASSQVLHAQRLGRIKQGLEVDGLPGGFDPTEASEECCELLEQKRMPFYGHIPPLLRTS